MIEEMVTRLVLQDGFTPVLRKIAGEQDAYARRTTGLNTAGNVFLGVGAGLVAVGVRALDAAGKVDEFRRVVAKTQGQAEADFAANFVNQFDKHSSFAYGELIDTAERLELQNVKLGKSFQDVADLAASSGRPLMQVAALYDAVNAGRVGLALSARGGFSQFGISTKDIFDAAGKRYTPGHNYQNAMSKSELLDAVHKVLVEKGRSGIDTAMATTTLRGAKSMIEGASTRLLSDMGSAELGNVIVLLNNAAGALNNLDAVVKAHPRLTAALIPAGLGAVAVGAVLKGVGAWRTYHEILGRVTGAAKAERDGELVKVGVAGQEAAAVATGAAKYGKLGLALEATGRAYLGPIGAEVSYITAIQTGITTAGLYGVALGGLAVIIGEVGFALHDLYDAQQQVTGAQAANAAAIKQGYDVKMGAPTGDAARPAWQNYLRSLGNVLTLGHAFKDDPGGFTALTDPAMRAKAARDGMPRGGVRAHQIAEEHAAAARARQEAQAAARERAQAAAQAADKYQGDPALEYKINGDERRLALLDAQHAGQTQINAARQTEIRDLTRKSELLREQARLTDNARDRFRLLNDADEATQKAALLKLDKKKGDGLDRAVATIIDSSGTLSADDISKKLGINGRFFQSFDHKHPLHVPGSPMKSAVAALARRPMNVTIQLGDKSFASVKTEIKDEVLLALVQVLEGSGAALSYGSPQR